VIERAEILSPMAFCLPRAQFTLLGHNIAADHFACESVLEGLTEEVSLEFGFEG
jgi:hypothetical protein